jgi:hypothetical protein
LGSCGLTDAAMPLVWVLDAMLRRSGTRLRARGLAWDVKRGQTSFWQQGKVNSSICLPMRHSPYNLPADSQIMSCPFAKQLVQNVIQSFACPSTIPDRHRHPILAPCNPSPSQYLCAVHTKSLSTITAASYHTSLAT